LGTFFKVVFFGLLVMVILSCLDHHHWGQFDFNFNSSFADVIIEPIVGLVGGIVGLVGGIIGVLVALVVVGLVIAGLLGSALLGGLAIVAVAGMFLFGGLVFSWPVLLVGLVVWLMVRERPVRRRQMRY
jgi:hypothetical protein